MKIFTNVERRLPASEQCAQCISVSVDTLQQSNFRIEAFLPTA